jgi:hypothetical protein
MNSLRTARVLIIDDTPSEAMPVVEALGKLGIGCVYVSGEKVEEIEKLKPLKGIRIAFVDMKLGVEGTAKEVVGKTVKVLKAVLSQNTLPLVFVAWTQHPEYVNAFTQALRDELSFVQPLIVHRMQKPIRADGTIKMLATFTGLKRILTQHWPLSLIWDLEQMAHEAATETTQSLSEVVSKDAEASVGADETAKAGAWFRVLQKILRKLILAGAGKNDEGLASQQGLLETFSAMQFERFQDVARPALAIDISRLCELAKPKLSIEQIAALNSMLLLLPVHTADASVKPGNIYLPKPRLKLKCPLTRCGIKASELASPIPLKFSKDAEWKKLDDELQKARRKNQTRQVTKLENAITKRKQAILRLCIPVLLELTPACDHAQSKSSGSRFVAGLLFPDEHAKILDWGTEEPPFLRRLEPLPIPGKKGTWHLVLNARSLHSISNARRKIRSVAATRLREGIQNDVRAWFAAHAARPGYLSVR